MGIDINGMQVNRTSVNSSGQATKNLPLDGLILHLDSEHINCYPGSDVSANAPYNSTSATIYDLSGRGNNFTYYVGASATAPTLYNGRFFQFNGSNQYMKIGTDILPTDVPYTIIVWLYPFDMNSMGCSFPIYNTYGNGSPYGFWHHFCANGATLSWRHYSGGYGDGSGDVALNASNNAWQMIAITWNNDGTTTNSYIKTYKNGALQGSAAVPYGHGNVAGKGGTIGMLNYRSTSSDYNYNGLIGLHLLYQRDLSEYEIKGIYNLYRSRYGI
jgi:hypothetical protein